MIVHQESPIKWSLVGFVLVAIVTAWGFVRMSDLQYKLDSAVNAQQAAQKTADALAQDKAQLQQKLADVSTQRDALLVQVSALSQTVQSQATPKGSIAVVPDCPPSPTYQQGMGVPLPDSAVSSSPALMFVFAGLIGLLLGAALLALIYSHRCHDAESEKTRLQRSVEWQGAQLVDQANKTAEMRARYQQQLARDSAELNRLRRQTPSRN